MGHFQKFGGNRQQYVIILLLSNIYIYIFIFKSTESTNK